MRLTTERYLDQVSIWPNEGNHILAHYDAESIIGYQAYRPTAAHFALKNGFFGESFSYSRMSWIKPNFLWMMYRSGWGSKEAKEVVLALRIRRVFFDQLLSQAIPSSWNSERFPSEEQWTFELRRSAVRLQWDPDHAPNGEKVTRRALQLGLRDEPLKAYGRREILEVIDMSNFVAEQKSTLNSTGLSMLATPSERVYQPADPAIAAWIGISDPLSGK